MSRPSWLASLSPADGSPSTRGPFLADGGEPESGGESEGADEGGGADESDERDDPEASDGGDEEASRATRRDDEGPDGDRANVEVADAGEATPADPKWEEPDLDEIPEFEIGGEYPARSASRQESATGGTEDRDPTAGRPNEARSPGGSRIKAEGTEGYIVALELCARLPDDVRLPAEAADLVPAAVEAELEEDIRSFAAAEFDNPSPTVDTLEFVERDDEVWLRLRLGIPPDAFADLDPNVIRTRALEELEGMF